MSAKDDCYALIQQIVVKRDVFCRYPSCFQRSTAGHHLFRRDRLGTAFVPDAVVGLCAEHHMPNHVSSSEFKQYIALQIGEGYHEELRMLSEQIIREKEFDFGQCRRYLRRML